MRALLLFDIDGTLVRGGPARDAFEVAMLEVFGTAGPMDGHDFGGKTDPQIAKELLTLAGFPAGEIEGGLPDLWERYTVELETRLLERPMEVLPGVPVLLATLEADPDLVLGLVTGNIARGAELKLLSAGVTTTFGIGAFGSDSELRNHLPGVALERARASLGIDFSDRAVVIGDTPRDIECGRAHGARTVAVATGHHSAESLEREGPDAVLVDFCDLEITLSALLT